MSHTVVSFVDIVIDAGRTDWAVEALVKLHREAQRKDGPQADVAAQQADRLVRWLRERRKKR